VTTMAARTESGQAMRALTVTENVTVDGVIEATVGWFAPAGDDLEADPSDVQAAIREQMEAADAFLVGRTTFEEMRGYWPQQADDPSGISDYLNRVSKYVVSSTLTDPEWEPSTVLRGPVRDEIEALKSKPGKDIVTTGSLTLGSRAHRRRSGRRVPAVPVPGGAGAWPAPVRRPERRAEAAARGDPTVSLRDRALALPDGVARKAHLACSPRRAGSAAPDPGACSGVLCGRAGQGARPNGAMEGGAC
jgi:dihydrofolate reductase